MPRVLLCGPPEDRAWQARLEAFGWQAERLVPPRAAAWPPGDFHAYVGDAAAPALPPRAGCPRVRVGLAAGEVHDPAAWDRALPGQPTPTALLLALHRLFPVEPPSAPEAVFALRAALSREAFGEGLLARLEALDAALDADPPDLATARQRAHALAGTAGTLGWSATSHAAHALERALVEGREPRAAWTTLRAAVTRELRDQQPTEPPVRAGAPRAPSR